MPIIPLSDAEYQLARDTVNMEPAVMDFLKKCEACGLPVEGHVEAVKTDCAFCKAVLENFFPDRQ